MEEFVAYIIKNLVSQPEAVQVTAKEDAEVLKLEVRVAPDDVGKLIGRKGNTINALRTIIRTVATRLKRLVQIELVQAERPPKKGSQASAVESMLEEDEEVEVSMDA